MNRKIFIWLTSSCLCLILQLPNPLKLKKDFLFPLYTLLHPASRTACIPPLFHPPIWNFALTASSPSHENLSRTFLPSSLLDDSHIFLTSKICRFRSTFLFGWNEEQTKALSFNFWWLSSFFEAKVQGCLFHSQSSKFTDFHRWGWIRFPWNLIEYLQVL